MDKGDELKYLESLGLHVIKPGLQRITKALNCFDNPQNSYESILIAGTNGKGSVASVLTGILNNNEYKVGLYTSPHLIKVNERISVNGTDISDDELCYYIKIVKSLCDKNILELSYFEFITVIAYLYFKDKKINIAVLETGMGGRWDATNTVIPMVSVITNISYDHMQYLGTTIELITEEKAQIIKHKIPVVTGCNGSALEGIKRRAKYCSCECYVYDEDFHVDYKDHINISYFGMRYNIEDFATNLTAEYQISNIAVSLAVIDTLISKYNMYFSDDKIRNALKNVNWPGRFQILCTKRNVLTDCAHNEAAARALVNSLKKEYPNTKFYFMIGMLKDKRHTEFINIIKDISLKIYIVDDFSDRATDSAELALICRDLEVENEILNNSAESISNFINSHDNLCITGSVYLVGLVIKLVKGFNIQ